MAQTIFQEEMDALVVTNQEPAREMMIEEMILTEAIVTTDVIVPIKYVFFKNKKKRTCVITIFGHVCFATRITMRLN